MKQANAIENEKQRKDPDSLGTIYLHKEGKFYHVYEWSAWLIKTVTCTEQLLQERGDLKILQANHYITKNNDYVMLGFPVESLSKFVGEYSEVLKVNENTLAILIQLPEELNSENIQELFESWRNIQPVKDSKKSTKDITVSNVKASVIAGTGIFSILSKVLAYPVERMTPADNIEFIGNIKQDIIKLL